MAPDVGIFTKSADIVVRAGANCNTTALTVAETDKYVGDVEALICCATQKNWLSAYAGLSTNIKFLLKEAGASLCAMKVINYDLSGFPSLLEAQTRLDVLDEASRAAIQFLKDQDVKSFIV